MTERERQPTVISTFSGCGGSTLGYRMAGFKVRLAVEWDDHAVETYRANYPDTPVFHGDVAQLTSAKARELSGLEDGEELDLFDGSPPCQGFSTAAGKRDSEDSRNQLFIEYARLLRELRPRAFIMENVKGMVTGEMLPIFDECMRELRGCGYRVKARVLNAKWYGVAQSRQRVIFIGIREDLGIDPSHPAPSVARPVTVAEALAGLVVPPELVPPPVSDRYRQIWSRLPPGRSIKDAVMRAIGSKSWFGTMKISPDKPCPTICRTVGVDGFAGLLHWREPRVMAIPEIKRLAGFPDSYIFPGEFHAQWARIGNCVPPPLMAAVASHVRALLGS